MKKFSKKSVVVFVGVMAVYALAVPSMASALSWGPVGNNSVLHSSNLSFTADPQPNAGSSCATSTFNVTVASAAVLNVTGTTFTNCMGVGASTNCTVTATGHSFPWVATPTNPIQIHTVNVTILFENTPGAGSACATPVHATLTGTLTGGTWSNVEHGFTLTNATGLFVDPPGSSITVSGTFQDLVAPFVTLS